MMDMTAERHSEGGLILARASLLRQQNGCRLSYRGQPCGAFHGQWAFDLQDLLSSSRCTAVVHTQSS